MLPNKLQVAWPSEAFWQLAHDLHANANRISATLPPEDQHAVLTAIGTIAQKLPFLIDLTTRERVGMAKLGDKTQAFVKKGVDIATQHQALFASNFLE